jgi:hypothetical protein
MLRRHDYDVNAGIGLTGCQWIKEPLANALR